MKQIEIKTKKAQQKLAEELMAELKDAVECFGNYEVKMVQADVPHIKVKTNGQGTGILTGAAVENVMEVISWYKVRYNFSVRFYIDVEDGMPLFDIFIEKYIIEK